MAYLRGDYYIWADGDDRLHIWARDGADGWEQSGWAVDASGQRSADRVNAGGVSILHAVMDEYVMMRLAQLIESNAIGEVIDRAIRHGNFGGQALAARGEAIRNALQHLTKLTTEHTQDTEKSKEGDLPQ